jgi:hypothetical protein
MTKIHCREKDQFEDTQEVFRSRNLKRDRQYNVQKNDKRTYNDIQNTTQKTNNRTTLTPLEIMEY